MNMMRVTKREFEARLFASHGNRMTKDLAIENTMVDGRPTVSRTTLYYLNDEHFASWGGGQGWFIGSMR